jgi:hypothetical protein
MLARYVIDSQDPIPYLHPTYHSIGLFIAFYVDGANTHYLPHNTEALGGRSGMLNVNAYASNQQRVTHAEQCGKQSSRGSIQPVSEVVIVRGTVQRLPEEALRRSRFFFVLLSSDQVLMNLMFGTDYVHISRL